VARFSGEVSSVASVYAAIFYGAAYLTGLAIFASVARRRGMATEGIWALMVAALIGGLGAANLVQLLVAGSAGKTILGAVAGGYLAVIFVKRQLCIARPTGDLFAFALSAGEAVGRIGCFIGGCCYGKITNVPWATYEDGALRHPTQLYLSAAAALTYWALTRFEKLHPPENSIFFLQGLLMCGFRFVVEFYRDGSLMVGSLTDAQWACAAGILFFGVKLMQTLRASEVRPFSTAATAASS
jgi:phosphatidylglycerol:prolipoprotein diacylglycerol transferase